MFLDSPTYTIDEKLELLQRHASSVHLHYRQFDAVDYAFQRLHS